MWTLQEPRSYFRYVAGTFFTKNRRVPKMKHPKIRKPLCLQGFQSSGSWTRTSDLRVMSPTSYLLLYPAICLYDRSEKASRRSNQSLISKFLALSLSKRPAIWTAKIQGFLFLTNLIPPNFNRKSQILYQRIGNA